MTAIITDSAILQILFYCVILLILVKPLGWYMAQVYEGRPYGLTWLRPLENFIYRSSGVRANDEMNWKRYAGALLIFNLIGFIFVFLLQLLQAHLPLNPQQFAATTPDLAFNTAISFVTNTNWQAYGGETTMSYLTQMLGLTVQNFLSAATGMAILIAVIRGLTRKQTSDLGNFWVDMVRSTLYILLPLSIILAVLLSAQGVIQNFKPSQTINLVQPTTYQLSTTDAKGHSSTKTVALTQQTIPMGPVASQVAIKQLGSNGGGYFNVNSAHPFENPTPFSNFLEMLALLLIPAALCYTFGCLVGDRRQGWAILAAMFIIFIPLVVGVVASEQAGNPAFTQLGVDSSAHAGLYPGGNMEGKETRFGITNSALWATATTASSNGSVNAMLDSFTPVGGMLPLWLMHLSEVVFGGVGSGLYGMLIFIIVTVFIAGLMVGKTPEYLGKKIEPYEMKVAAWIILAMPMSVLLFTAIAVLNKVAAGAVGNPGMHGFTEILYAFTSMTNNNGSAFSGLNANLPFYNILGGIAMFIGRYAIAIPVLMIAGSLAKKKMQATNVGTLPTHTLLFILMLVAVIIIVGALTFLPALAMGPIVEQLQMLQ
jgi:K+-transporting ATPase ATPase A chain